MTVRLGDAARAVALRLGWSGGIALVALALLVVAIAAPGLIAPGDPLAIAPAEAFRPPSLAHPAGTDESGRDILLRILHGTRASAGIGLAATVLGIGLGLVIGFAAGLGPAWLDAALGRIIEVLFALPTLVMALLLVAVLGPGTGPSILAIGFATAPGYARILRSRVRSVVRSDYVGHARSEGVSALRVFVRHIAPNTVWPLVATVTLGVGQAIVWVSALSFLGLGAPPPSPEWGAMLNAGRVYISTAWWMTVFPGLAIVLTATVLTLLGRRMSAAAPDTHRSREPRPHEGHHGAGDTAPVDAGGAIRADRLSVALPGAGEILHDVSLSVSPGECLAIVGESGAGKSVLARTLLGLTHDAPGSRIDAERVEVAGRDLRLIGRRGRRTMRGRDVALVLQDALQSLDPLRTIEAEVGETLAIRRVPRAERRRRVVEALRRAGLPVTRSNGADPLLRRRSGELSGGMRQRALIASAVVGGAPILIADEPTTALDATTAIHVLALLGRMRDEGTALVLISHDLRAVARVADRIAVMEDGRIVETGAATELLGTPQHEATRALLAAVPTGAKPGATAPEADDPQDPSGSSGDRLITATHLMKTYRGAGDSGVVTAVDDVSLTLDAGEVLGVVGESGSGKSTLARLLNNTERRDSGGIAHATPPPRIRLIPQDPLGSFDPRHSVERILRLSRRDDAPHPADLLARVGLDESLLPRRPATLSGGQRQRVAIARALAARPDVLICDEPVSALDVTTQAGILDLLIELQREERVGMIFISHDLAVVRRVSDRVAVMLDGRIVETGRTESVYAAPSHPFTVELISAGS